MSLDQAAIDTPQQGISRKGFMARLGATIIGVAAASTLASQQKAYAAAPYCCSGHDSCGSVGCSCGTPGSGGCCWWCMYSKEPDRCTVVECCDKTCAHFGTCICARLICSGGCC